MARDVRTGLSAARADQGRSPNGGREKFGRAEGRSFAFPVGAAFMAIGVLFWWRGHLPVAGALGSAGLLLALAGALAPTRLAPVYRLWMALAAAISKVTTPVFMSIVYYLVLTPTGLLRRTFGRHPLQREGGSETYWIRRQEKKASDLTRQF